MAQKKVLFITPEIYPYFPEGYISNICRYLPQGIQERENEIRTFMPKFGCVNDHKHMLHEVIRLSGQNIIIEDTDHPLIIKVASIQSAKIQVYFIDNDDYFNKRQMERNEEGVDYSDNGERAIFFARGVLETVKKLRWVPDIIHCHGWMSAVVPLYIKTAYHDEPSFTNTKVITSLFAKSLTKNLGDNFKRCVEFREATSDILEPYSDNFDFDELGKLAIDFSDGIIETEGASKHLLDYANKKETPILKFNNDSFADAIEDFYNQIAPDTTPEEEEE